MPPEDPTELEEEFPLEDLDELEVDANEQITPDEEYLNELEERIYGSGVERFVNEVTEKAKDPYLAIKLEADRFKQKFEDLDPQRITGRLQQAREFLTTPALQEDRLNRYTQRLSARPLVPTNRLVEDNSQVETRSQQGLIKSRLDNLTENYRLKRGVVAKASVLDYYRFFRTAAEGSGTGKATRIQVAMFQFQNTELATQLASLTARKNVDLSLISQVYDQRPASELQTTQEITSALEAYSIIGPTALTEKLLNDARPSTFIAFRSSKQLMHAKIGYTERYTSPGAFLEGDRGQIEYRSGFIGTQNLTRALANPNTQEETLFIEQLGQEAQPEEGERGIKSVILTELKRSFTLLNPNNSSSELVAITQDAFRQQQNRYIFIDKEAQDAYPGFLERNLTAGRKVGINVQYIEKFLLADPSKARLTPEEETSWTNYEERVTKRLLDLAREQRLSVAVSQSSMDPNLGFFALMSRLEQGVKVSSEREELLRLLLEQKAFKIIPTRFLHTKAMYAFGAENELEEYILGSQNLSTAEYTISTRNREALGVFDQEAIRALEIERSWGLTNTTFNRRRQGIQLERWASGGMTDNLSDVLRSAQDFMSSGGNLPDAFKFNKRYSQELNRDIPVGASLQETARALASGFDITMASGYSFSVTVGSYYAFDYSRPDKEGGYELTEQPVIYSNKGNRTITGAVFKNRLDSGVEAVIPGTGRVIKPGETVRLSASEVLTSLVYTLSKAEQFEQDIGAPVRAVRRYLTEDRDGLKYGLLRMLERGGSSSEDIIKYLETKNDRYSQNNNVLFSEDRTLKEAGLETLIRSRFSETFDDLRKGKDRLQIAAALSEKIYDAIDSGEMLQVRAFADILKHLVLTESNLGMIYDRELRIGRRLVTSSVTSNFPQFHELGGIGNQLLYQQPVYEISQRVARLHGVAIKPDKKNLPRIGLLLNPADISHYDVLGSVTKGGAVRERPGQFIRGVSDASQVRSVADPNMIGGLTKVEGGPTKATFALGFNLSMPELSALTKRKLQADYKKMQLPDNVTKQLIAELYQKDYNEIDEEEILYYFPFRKTEQLSQRLKNVKSQRRLLEASSGFRDFVRQLGLGSSANFFDQEDYATKMFGGELPADLPPEQFAYVKRLKEEGLTRDQIINKLRTDQLNYNYPVQGTLGGARPKQFMISMGISMLSDFGLMNSYAAQQEQLVDIQRQSYSFDTVDVGPDFSRKIQETLTKGTMFVAKEYELTSQGSGDVYQRFAARAEQLIDQEINQIRTSKELAETAELDEADLKRAQRAAAKQLRRESYITPVFKDKQVSNLYLDSGVYKPDYSGETPVLRRVGRMTPRMSFWLYGLDTESTRESYLKRKQFLPIINQAISKREDKAITYLAEDATLIQHSSSQVMLEMPLATGLQSSSGKRPTGFKGPFLYLTSDVFQQLAESYGIRNDYLSGILAPGQIKGFNFTHGFNLLRKGSDFRTSLKADAETGRRLALGLSLLIADQLPEGADNRVISALRGAGAKNLFTRVGGKGSISAYTGLIELVDKNRLEAGFETAFRKRVSAALTSDSAAEALATGYLSLIDKVEGQRVFETYRSDLFTRSASLTAILTSMVEDIQQQVDRPLLNKGLEEIPFGRNEVRSYLQFHRSDDKDAPAQRENRRIYYAQRQHARALGFELSEDEQELSTQFEFLRQMFARNIYVRQYFEYGTSRIAVSTGMAETSPLEAAYVASMTKQQLELQTFNPKILTDATRLQEGLVVMGTVRESLLTPSQVQKRYALQQEIDLLSLHQAQARPEDRKQTRALVSVAAFTSAYSSFNRKDLPDVDDGAIDVDQVGTVYETLLRNLGDSGREGLGSRVLRRRSSDAIRKLKNATQDALAVSMSGEKEIDFADQDFRNTFTELVIDIHERSFNRQQSQDSEENRSFTPERQRFTQLLEDVFEQRVPQEEGQAREEYERYSGYVNSIYSRLVTLKTATEAGGGSDYLEALRSLSERARAKDLSLSRRLERLTTGDSRRRVSAAREDNRRLLRSVTQTRILTLPTLYLTGEEKDGRLGAGFIDSGYKPVTGVLLGLDVLNEFQLVFHGYTDSLLEEQRRLRAGIAAAEEQNLFTSIELQARSGEGLYLTTAQLSVYTDLVKTLDKSKNLFYDLFENTENIRRIQGDRLKRVGTSYVAVSSFLAGDDEVFAGSRLERVQNPDTINTAAGTMSEIALRKFVRKKADAERFIRALRANYTAMTSESGELDYGRLQSELQAVRAESFEGSKEEKEKQVRRKQLQIIQETLYPADTRDKFRVGGSLQAAARTGEPHAVSPAPLPARALTIEEQNRRADRAGSFIKLSEEFNSSVLVLSSLGYTHMQLGDYDGDTFAVAYSQIVRLQAEVERTRVRLSRIDKTTASSRELRKLLEKQQIALQNQLASFVISKEELDRDLRTKREQMLIDFTSKYTLLDRRLVAAYNEQYKGGLHDFIKQYRDTLSNAYDNVDYIDKNFAEVLFGTSYEDGQLRFSQQGREFERTQERITAYYNRLVAETNEQITPDNFESFKDRIIEAEAADVNLRTALGNAVGMAGKAAGSLLSEQQLEIMQTITGTSGMGLLGQTYNALMPVVELTQADQAFLKALDSPEFSEVIEKTLGSGFDRRWASKQLKERLEGRVSASYRLTSLTQQFMRDAALKPKDGMGVLYLAANSQELANYSELNAEERQVAFKRFLDRSISAPLLQGKANQTVTSFGALSLLQEYLGGKSIDEIIDQGAISNYLTGKLKDDPAASLENREDFVRRSLVDLISDFESTFVLDSVLGKVQKQQIGQIARGFAERGELRISVLEGDTDELVAEKAIRRTLFEQSDYLDELLKQTRTFNQGVAGLSDVRLLKGHYEDVNKKLIASAMKIRRGASTAEDITDYVRTITRTLPEVANALINRQESSEQLSDDQRKALVRGYSMLLSVTPLGGSSLLGASEQQQERFITELASKPDVLQNVVEQQALLSSSAESVRIAQDYVDQLEQIRALDASPEEKARLEEDAEQRFSDQAEAYTPSPETSRLNRGAQFITEVVNEAQKQRDTKERIRRTKGSHFRGEVASVLAIPFVMASLQGNTPSADEFLGLGVNVLQGALLTSGIEGTELGKQIYGTEETRTARDRTRVAERAFQLARARSFIRSQEDPLVGMAQGAAFEALSLISARASAEFAQRIGQRMGAAPDSSVLRGGAELAGSIAGMVAAGILTQRPIPGTNQNMGGLPEYVGRALSEIAQSVQGAAQRYIQEVLSDDAELDGEKISINEADASPNEALSDFEKDLWTGRAGVEEQIVIYDTQEAGSEEIELNSWDPIVL